MSRTCTQVAEAHPPQWPGWSPVGSMPMFPIIRPADFVSTLDKRLASRTGGSLIQRLVRVKLSKSSPVMGDNWFPPFSVRNLAHIYHRFTPELYPGISNRRDKGGRKVLCKLVQDSIAVSGQNYPSGLRTTGARVDRISTRPGALLTVSTGFPVRSLGLLPLPQWGLSVWNHVPSVLLTSQLRFRRNVDQISGVATSHNPFTQPLTGKEGSFLWDR